MELSEHWWLDALCLEVGPVDTPTYWQKVSRAEHKIAGERPRRLLDTGPGCGRTRMRGSTMTDVIWIPAPRLPGYEISSDGRIRSTDRWVTYRDGRKPRWYAGCERATFVKGGYKGFSAAVGGEKRNAHVHVLVCEAFHGPRPSGVHEARHLNGDPFDNRAENLAWGTKVENAQDSIRHGTNKELNKTHCKRRHEFNLENTRVGKNGSRGCRACSRMRGQRYYDANRVEVSRRTRERLEKRAAQDGRTLRKRHRTALTESTPLAAVGAA